MVRIIVLALLATAITGCIVTKAGAYRVFAEDLERLQGQSFNEAYVYNIGYLAKLSPDNVKLLASGNEIKTYKVKPPRKQDCTVHIEIGKNKNIVGATSEGPECWRAY
jgi:hypothetical protein